MNNSMDLNKQLFESIYIKMKKIPEDDFNKKMIFAHLASTCGWLSHPGFYVHIGIEQELHNIAKKLQDHSFSLPSEIPKTKKSSLRFLHILTTAYTTGGHTRLVERWINSRLHYNETHSIILLDQRDTSFPQWLLQATENTGGFFNIVPNNLNLIERALYLRQVAYKYADYVVLHIHPNDPIPSVAFGKPGGPPVIFLNHADEAFWLGAGISDMVADLRIAGRDYSVFGRRVRQSEILPIPLVSEKKTLNNSNRKKYGISTDNVVLLTIASAHKLMPINQLDYKKFMLDILRECNNTVLFIVGSDPTNPIWQDAMNQNKNIKVIPTTENISEFYHMADIYVESFPIASPTSSLDATLYGIPVVRAPFPLSPLLSIDLYAGMNKNAESFESYKGYLLKMINDENYRVYCGKIQKEEVTKKHVSKGWNSYLDRLLNKMPDHHSVGFSSSNLTQQLNKQYEQTRAEMQLINGVSNGAKQILSHYTELLED